MELHALDINPIPGNPVVGTVDASDGTRLRTAYWRPKTSPAKGTVCLLQGRAEFIELYFEAIEDLIKRGFAVAAFDWRGQGGSARKLRDPRKGHVDSFDEYDRDLDAFMQQVAFPDCPPPYFALAHSTGGLVCLRAAHARRSYFSRVVLMAPLTELAIRRASHRTIHTAAAILTAIGLGEISAPGGRRNYPDFEDNPLTSDQARFDRNQAIRQALPDLAIGPPTFGWLYAACRAMSEASGPDFTAPISVPALVVAGMLDGVVSVRSIEAMTAELRTGTLILIPGARHELLMERETLREQFWAAFDAFVPGQRR